jgi:hypothetical protein
MTAQERVQKSMLERAEIFASQQISLEMPPQSNTQL